MEWQRRLLSLFSMTIIKRWLDPLGSEEEGLAVGTLRKNTEVDLHAFGEGEAPGHVELAAVSGFNDVDVQNVMDDWVTLFSYEFCSDSLSAFARFYCICHHTRCCPQHT